VEQLGGFDWRVVLVCLREQDRQLLLFRFRFRFLFRFRFRFFGVGGERPALVGRPFVVIVERSAVRWWWHATHLGIDSTARRDGWRGRGRCTQHRREHTLV
jgi:hypothetical protein